MPWRAALLARIGQIEAESLAAVDGALLVEATRLRGGLEAERQRLRAGLLDAARTLAHVGDAASDRALLVGCALAAEAPDEGRRGAALAASIGCYDRVRSLSLGLADEIRAAEGVLAGPLVRAGREAIQEGLPGLREIVASAARRTAEQQRGAIDVSTGLTDRVGAHASSRGRDAEVEAWGRRMADTVAHARSAATERVDAALRGAKVEVDAVISRLNQLPARLGPMLVEAASSNVRPVVLAARDARIDPRPALWRRVLAGIALLLAAGVVVGFGVLGMGIGMGGAGAAVGALALAGTFVPTVAGGLLAGFVGCALAALFTDLLFGVLGDWRLGVRDGLLGVVGPVVGPIPPIGRLPEVERLLVLPRVEAPLPVVRRGGLGDLGTVDTGVDRPLLYDRDESLHDVTLALLHRLAEGNE